LLFAKGGRAARPMQRYPGNGHEDACGAQSDEHGAPSDAQHQPGEDRGRDGQANGLRHAHHRRSAAPSVHRKPFADATHARRIERRLPYAEENAKRKECGERSHQSGQHLCGRPDCEAGTQNDPRSGSIQQTDQRKLRKAISQGEGREQQAHLGSIKVHLAADRAVRNRERGSIQEVDHPREEEERQRNRPVPEETSCSDDVLLLAGLASSAVVAGTRRSQSLDVSKRGFGLRA
jgi:hypothetical protein